MPIPVSVTVKCSEHVVIGFGSDSDLNNHFALVREFDGVTDEIDNHLPQPAGVSEQAAGNIGRYSAGKFQSLFVSAEPKRLAGIANDVG